ncbi:galactokinase/mevalonate kinase-like predicted kinase [Breznakibacter xylanolyticus]|uniref:Galactokinase/mevalonate kinase-like predicted kinase n=1 Tax=Breznakibacter xylanolyticus TaxID=990 RepID=A0A2W7P5G5_9BACT|nr:bifunctional fucokinase/fucose-1-phosphate guanylyltransferase [Breznakibacter xylanolyticus]PZX18652.1 galactokinase/mevalonate kinase-like predicted kinase [Breznakibacter xylanolyticus]
MQNAQELNRCRKLLSLPDNLVPVFHDLQEVSKPEWFVTCDPQGQKVGSGGGTAWLLAQDNQSNGVMMDWRDYLSSSKKIIIHAGGQSRRLPAYAPSGKILTPIPVFRWSRGQRVNQNLLDLQLPLYEQLMESTSPNVNTMIVSGDVLIMAPELPPVLPQADVICLGIWVDAHLASRHGVFFASRHHPADLDFMLQKPDKATIEKLAASHLFMMDIGVWLLSDRAVDVLMKKCGWNGAAFDNRVPEYYDLYSTFGTALGQNPSVVDPDVAALSVAIVPLEGGEFYHYGTSAELISSTEKIQNRVQDQRSIHHHRVKPHPSLFVLNARAEQRWDESHHHIWIENSHVPASWELTQNHIITGMPQNEWALHVPDGICLDIVPVEEYRYCIRPYHINDRFSGNPNDSRTAWMNLSVVAWLQQRELTLVDAGLDGVDDIQNAPLFPVLEASQWSGAFVQWMIDEVPACNEAFRSLWLTSARLSATQISAAARLDRLYEQRRAFRLENLPLLAANHHRSIFYQADLKQVANDYISGQLPLPASLPVDLPLVTRMQDAMFRSEVLRQTGNGGQAEETMAFTHLRELILSSAHQKEMPRLNVYTDQIVWGRSPVRLDLAGGWSDTPPFCIQNGGAVVNIAVDLNGQPPIQAFVRLSDSNDIVLRSIDNGVSERITTFDEVGDYTNVGSAFVIARAALCLAGFHPRHCAVPFASLQEQLMAFGGGLEISLLAAVPKGSGLGTSSILAATLLGALSDFCSLAWDKQTICHQTLLLEQMLTTGGGWQDQYGGIIGGVKLLETQPGIQTPMSIRWLPDHLFVDYQYKDNWLLYYTGITRVAKNILAEIVRGMFLNEQERLMVLNRIRHHARETFDAIQGQDYARTAAMIGRSWTLNKALDPGTTSPEIDAMVQRISDFAIGQKLLGAGGGGYMVICAKDAHAAQNIRQILIDNPLNNRARLVEMSINREGLQVTRS